jgi:hypothetical protein
MPVFAIDRAAAAPHRSAGCSITYFHLSVAGCSHAPLLAEAKVRIFATGQGVLPGQGFLIF